MMNGCKNIDDILCAVPQAIGKQYAGVTTWDIFDNFTQTEKLVWVVWLSIVLLSITYGVSTLLNKKAGSNDDTDGEGLQDKVLQEIQKSNGIIIHTQVVVNSIKSKPLSTKKVSAETLQKLVKYNRILGKLQRKMSEYTQENLSTEYIDTLQYYKDIVFSPRDFDKTEKPRVHNGEGVNTPDMTPEERIQQVEELLKSH